MNLGTEETSIRSALKKLKNNVGYIDIDPSQADPLMIHETRGELQARVEDAKMNGEDSIEADIGIILKLNHLFGKDGSKHVNYAGIKIFPTGKMEQGLRDMEMSIEERMHKGDAQGRNSVDDNG